MTIESTDLALGRGRICSRCGQPCRGSASVKEGNQPTQWYCHPSDGDYPDCYHIVTVLGGLEPGHPDGKARAMEQLLGLGESLLARCEVNP